MTEKGFIELVLDVPEGEAVIPENIWHPELARDHILKNTIPLRLGSRFPLKTGGSTALGK